MTAITRNAFRASGVALRESSRTFVTALALLVLACVRLLTGEGD